MFVEIDDNINFDRTSWDACLVLNMYTYLSMSNEKLDNAKLHWNSACYTWDKISFSTNILTKKNKWMCPILLVLDTFNYWLELDFCMIYVAVLVSKLKANFSCVCWNWRQYKFW